MITAADLAECSDNVLEQLLTLIPVAQHAETGIVVAVEQERQRRAQLKALWGDWRRLLRMQHAQWYIRHLTGYTPNEDARGIDEQDSYHWEMIRSVVRKLQRESGEITDEEPTIALSDEEYQAIERDVRSALGLE